MDIAIISDTHELHRDVDLPRVDLLLHAGDWTMNSRSVAAIADFNDWLGENQPRLQTVLVPGNHESYLEEDPNRTHLTDNAIVLNGSSYEIDGLIIWGSPITPMFGTAFGRVNPADRIAHYSEIPEDTDILITHSPPYGILDYAPGSEEHMGCRALRDAVERIQPMLHIFGHVHSGYGTLETEYTKYINAALLGSDGDIANPPIVLRLPRL